MTAALLLSLTLPALAAVKPAPPPAPHPLDPLSAQEIAAAVGIIRGSKLFPAGVLFPIVAAQEPPKEEVLAYRPGQRFSRQAFAVVFDRDRNETSEALVDLNTRALSSWRVIPDVQPTVLLEELTRAPEIVRADPRWQEAMRQRGITDFSAVQIDAWAPGTLGVTGSDGPRLVRALSFYKGRSKNLYARPVEGLVALLDMNAGKVVQLADTGAVPVSADEASYDEASQRSPRPQPKPLETLQTQGPDFEVRGHEVRWQKWRFRFAMHPREGLVLQQVGYEDNGSVRPILYRASLSEMLVPYGDPDANWAWRSALAEGEYGIGRLAAPLEPGVDVPENARLFDAVFADDFGKAYTLPRAAALYERDGGLLWKHYTIDGDLNESRRGRELVLTSMATVGNDDYSYSWIFRQDGSLECDVGLTGIMLAKGVAASAAPEAPFKHRVSSTLAAPNHQHFFNFRLDFDVDGTTNTVYELNTRVLPAGRNNPFGNAMAAEETPLATEMAARRDVNASTARRWIVRNPGSLNALGQPVGYALLPGDNTAPFLRPESPLRKRAPFINHPLWVTPYDLDQNYAAGDYPNQSPGRDGIDRWTTDDEPTSARDVVIWYTLGVTHVPRPEEWPVMPVAKAGFKLLPSGFFSGNPALDVARPARPKKKK